jgi:hypothetical protein
MKRALFALGAIVATPRAVEVIETYKIKWLPLLHRHVTGDWGDLDEADKKENDLSVQKEFRILSAYGRGKRKLWFITEAHGSVTTILRPEDY